MKEIANITKSDPNQKLNTCKEFVNKIKVNSESKKIMDDWCCKIDNNPIRFNS